MRRLHRSKPLVAEDKLTLSVALAHTHQLRVCKCTLIAAKKRQPANVGHFMRSTITHLEQQQQLNLIQMLLLLLFLLLLFLQFASSRFTSWCSEKKAGSWSNGQFYLSLFRQVLQADCLTDCDLHKLVLLKPVCDSISTVSQQMKLAHTQKALSELACVRPLINPSSFLSTLIAPVSLCCRFDSHCGTILWSQRRRLWVHQCCLQQQQQQLRHHNDDKLASERQSERKKKSFFSWLQSASQPVSQPASECVWLKNLTTFREQPPTLVAFALVNPFSRANDSNSSCCCNNNKNKPTCSCQLSTGASSVSISSNNNNRLTLEWYKEKTS